MIRPVPEEPVRLGGRAAEPEVSPAPPAVGEAWVCPRRYTHRPHMYWQDGADHSCNGTAGFFEAEMLARRFHDAGERLRAAAPHLFGNRAARPWRDLSDGERRLLATVCSEILAEQLLGGPEAANLRAEVDRLREDQAESDAVRDRLAGLLNGVAAALKGDPPPRVMHDWSDLPAVAAAVVAERDAAMPPGSEVREEWGTSHLDIESHVWIIGECVDRASAERRFADLDEVWGHHAELMQRRHITTAWARFVESGRPHGGELASAPLRPCASDQCGRLVSGSSLYCCGYCGAAWEATPRHEPHEHTQGCEQRDRERRPGRVSEGKG